MDYWEFLLQKEGDRSWRPIKSPNFEIEAGRYRVVAHSNRINTDVEICVIHETLDEEPPKRRFQKRSRRTNPEGLMVVIPFTYLKPGLWELRCCGDIMSDLLGKSWKQAVRLEVLPQVTEVLSAPDFGSPKIDSLPGEQVALSSESEPEKPLKESQEQVSLNGSQASQPDLVEPSPVFNVVKNFPTLQPLTSSEPIPIETEISPLTPVSSDSHNQDKIMEETKDLTAIQAQFREEQLDLEMDQLMEDLTSLISEHDSNTPQLNEAELGTPSTTDRVILHHPIEQENNPKPVLATINPTTEPTATNPILDQSLQMLEQILQQVLEPVLQEFDRPEPSSQEASTSDSDFSEDVVDEQGVMLTLNEDALVARRGESLTITGQVDALAASQLNNGEQSSLLNTIFQGTLRYELRDPQTLQVLLNVQQPLPEQELPLAFRHTLEIPPDCNTRLILGKVVLYGSSKALASQSFSVTADLDELLGAIIPASKAMPVAKMLVLSNSLAAVEQELSEPPPPLNQALLDLVDAPKRHQPISLQPASRQPLPPQLYQSAPEKSTPTPKASKSLQLPKLPKAPPVDISVPEPVEGELDAVAEMSQQESTETIEQSEIESLLQDEPLIEETSEVPIVSVVDSSTSTWDAIDWSDSLSVGDSEVDALEVTQTLEPAPSTVDSQQDTSETTDALAIASLDNELDVPESAEAPVTDEVTEVDSAFQALKLQDRFWLRLNSLAADAELSEWLKFELSPSHPPMDEVEVPQQSDETPFVDELEVTEHPNSEGLLTDFDESIWEASDDVEDISTEVSQLQSPVEETAATEEIAEPPLVQVDLIDWTAQEIVVEDDEQLIQQPEVKQDASGMVYPTEVLRSEPEPQRITAQESELPLPAPVLFIPRKELAAGEPVIVRIKLLPYPTRLCIKLWVQDRQSRSLLDGPRWLVDLLPDGTGNLEAMTQLIIPFGTTEIRFEAIAVDIHSQRESHKVTVDCVVVPPDMPDFSLDDFEA